MKTFAVVIALLFVAQCVSFTQQQVLEDDNETYLSFLQRVSDSLGELEELEEDEDLFDDEDEEDEFEDEDEFFDDEEEDVDLLSELIEAEELNNLAVEAELDEEIDYLVELLESKRAYDQRSELF
eukprot:TRINITY_DN1543_c0_g1_i1.p1 TRINITY_DN1543_c0_g1~~TRINITY_DN1543_c0_g1_i1.p1  ORF type:complete len:125 (-),score=51.49 TRINITY_DN1543_c0_g1_i1:108-482(-)